MSDLKKYDALKKMLESGDLTNSDYQKLISFIVEELLMDPEKKKDLNHFLLKNYFENSNKKSLLKDSNHSRKIPSNPSLRERNLINNDSWSKTILHNPKNTVRFLNHFSIDENFKWFTHKKERDFNFEEYCTSANYHFGQLRKIPINVKTYWSVYNFLFSNFDPQNYLETWEVFDGIKMKFGWKNIEQWCKYNPGKYPDIAELPAEYKFPDPKNRNFILLTFGDVIREFKNAIEIRNDDRFRTFDQVLKNLIKKVGLYDDFRIEADWDKIREVNVYSDVNLLLKGLKQIFQLCLQDKAKSNDIRISVASEKEYYELEIFHINSKIYTYDPSFGEYVIFDHEIRKIRNYFLCVCDWEIEADFLGGNSYKIELLNNNVNDVNIPPIITQDFPNWSGIKHKIKLYKTVNL